MKNYASSRLKQFKQVNSPIGKWSIIQKGRRLRQMNEKLLSMSYLQQMGLQHQKFNQFLIRNKIFSKVIKNILQFDANNKYCINQKESNLESSFKCKQRSKSINNEQSYTNAINEVEKFYSSQKKRENLLKHQQNLIEQNISKYSYQNNFFVKSSYGNIKKYKDKNQINKIKYFEEKNKQNHEKQQQQIISTDSIYQQNLFRHKKLKQAYNLRVKRNIANKQKLIQNYFHFNIQEEQHLQNLQNEKYQYQNIQKQQQLYSSNQNLCYFCNKGQGMLIYCNHLQVNYHIKCIQKNQNNENYNCAYCKIFFNHQFLFNKSQQNSLISKQKLK